jgi:microcystin-dependent protein
MSDYILSEIRIFAGDFVPRDWALCNGTTLNISTNPTLYSLVGGLYGGDGTTTFALPNMNARIPVNFGSGAGLTTRTIASTYGVETVTLTSSQLPSHIHPMMATGANATTTNPQSCLTGVTTMPIYDDSTGGYSMPALAAGSVLATGGSQAHNNVMPCLALTFMICIQNGIYPSQS